MTSRAKRVSLEVASVLGRVRGLAVAALVLFAACNAPHGVKEPARTVPVPSASGAVAARSAPPHPEASPRRAAPHPAVARVVALFAANAPPGSPPNAQPLDETACRALTGFEKDGFSRCTMELLANGTAVSVAVSYDCGEHTCSVVSYVWFGGAPEPYRQDGSAPIEVSPDHRHLLVTQLTYAEEIPVPSGGHTLAIDRRTGASSSLFDCFSARLSPGGRWYICRDIDANVLRVPVGGGAPELVVRAELPEGEGVKVGGPFNDYPAQVSFPGRTEVQYEIFLRDSGEVLVRRAAFRE